MAKDTLTRLGCVDAPSLRLAAIHGFIILRVGVIRVHLEMCELNATQSRELCRGGIPFFLFPWRASRSFGQQLQLMPHTHCSLAHTLLRSP